MRTIYTHLYTCKYRYLSKGKWFQDRLKLNHLEDNKFCWHNKFLNCRKWTKKSYRVRFVVLRVIGIVDILEFWSTRSTTSTSFQSRILRLIIGRSSNVTRRYTPCTTANVQCDLHTIVRASWSDVSFRAFSALSYVRNHGNAFNVVTPTHEWN